MRLENPPPANRGKIETTPDGTEDMATSNNTASKFFGGSPLAVLGRLILVSILVGVILNALDLQSARSGYPYYYSQYYGDRRMGTGSPAQIRTPRWRPRHRGTSYSGAIFWRNSP